MIQRRQNLAFAHEALTIGLGHFVAAFERMHLERDGLRQIIVAGQIDGRSGRFRDGLHQAVAGDFRVMPLIDGRGDRGGAGAARRLRQALQDFAQFADFHRMNRPVVVGAQFDRARGVALVAAACKYEDGQSGRKGARMRKPRQRVGRAVAHAELDDEKQRGVGRDSLCGQRIEARAADGVRIESRDCPAHQ